MKINKFINLTLLLLFLAGCEKKDTMVDIGYVFIKPFQATVTVGGFVGIKTLYYNVGDKVTGSEITEGIVTVRIAGHSNLNDGAPTSASYQEFLNIPSEYLIRQDK